MEHGVGFEPTHTGFADRRVNQLHHPCHNVHSIPYLFETITWKHS